MPEFTTEANRIACFDGVFRASLYADRIIAISAYSREHFLQTFPHYPSERITVVYPASRLVKRDDLLRPRQLAQLQPDQFWLTVGTLEPRKNHRCLLQAYARLKVHLGKTYPLVLAGGKGWLMDDFERTVDELELRQDVILLGYVEDAALQWLYENCFAFVYPSLFEGFGLPVLEAMSVGAPVIASETTSLPEIVGGAGLLVDPLSETSLAAALLQLTQDTQIRRDFRQRALERAKLFSWTKSAKRVVDLYQETLTQPRRLSAQETPSDPTGTK